MAEQDSEYKRMLEKAVRRGEQPICIIKTVNGDAGVYRVDDTTTKLFYVEEFNACQKKIFLEEISKNEQKM